ncbi:unnamed protein product [Pedinophyceae sp. YPF-701]|nr:unnamed protein product [Pedinophyceae sp. YPF-701]
MSAFTLSQAGVGLLGSLAQSAPAAIAAMRLVPAASRMFASSSDRSRSTPTRSPELFASTFGDIDATDYSDAARPVQNFLGLGSVHMPQALNTEEPCTVTIAGGGNSAHVAAAVLGSNPSFQVRMWSTLDGEAARLNHAIKSSGGLIRCSYSDGKPPTSGRVAFATADPAEALEDTDMLLLTAPSYTHAQFLRHAAPHLPREGLYIGATVAQAGFDWMVHRALRDADVPLPEALTIFAFEILPWICRLDEFGKSVRVLGTKRALDMAVEPRVYGPAVADMMTALFAEPVCRKYPGGLRRMSHHAYPKFAAVPSFMGLSLMNVGAVWHPCLMYGRFKDWDKSTPFQEHLRLSKQIEPATSQLLNSVSVEILAIRAALEDRDPTMDLTNVSHIFDWILRAYPGDMADTSGLARAIETNAAWRTLRHPMIQRDGGWFPDNASAYFSEDIPCGLVPIRGLAQLLDVPTPHIDEVLTWCQDMMGKEYLVDGQLVGRDVRETRAPQAYGVTCVRSLRSVVSAPVAQTAGGYSGI